MGLCLSCCGGNSGSCSTANGLQNNNSTEGRQRQGRGNEETNQNTQMMDECTYPAKFTLGQSFPQDKATPRSTDHLNLNTPSRMENRTGILMKIAASWSSPIPITQEELAIKREEFWETVPAYGGCPTVWQALRQAIEVGHVDIDTARTILTCAGVTTPTGRITEAYDDRGYKYIIPFYCLSDPTNGLLKEQENDDAHTSVNETSIDYKDLSIFKMGEEEYELLVRLSTGKDERLQVPISSNFRIGHLKTLLLHQQDFNNLDRIELFWSGHGPLSDHLSLTDIKGLREQDHGLLQAWIFTDPSINTS